MPGGSEDLTELRQLEWLEPWEPTGPGLENELAREVGEGHVLSGRLAVAVARRRDNDDVLFHLPEGPAPFAVVHLTWTGSRERRPEWPWTELYRSVEEFAVRRMRPDHAGGEAA